MLKVLGCLAGPLGYLLNFIYDIVQNYGIAIILFTVLLKLIMIPMSVKQQKSMKKNQLMQEKMKEIKEKYSNDPEKLNQETIELYKRENMSPFSGCFTSILQLIILMSIFLLVAGPLTYMKKVENNEELKAIVDEYSEQIKAENSNVRYMEIAEIAKIESEYNAVIYNIEHYDEYVSKQSENKKNEELNNQNNDNLNNETDSLNDENIENSEEIKILTKEELEKKKENLEKLRINMNFLGLDLSTVPTQDLFNIKALIIPILYVISTIVSMKITTATTKKKKKEEKIVSTNEKGLVKKENEEPDLMEDMNKNMSLMMPIMSVSIALIAPLGLALYWLINNLLMIVERLVINKYFKED